MTWDEAVWEVMKNRVYAARVNAVVKRIQRLKLRDLGTNPYQAVYQALNSGSTGTNPRYEKVGKAQFKRVSTHPSVDPTIDEEDDDDTEGSAALDDSGVVTAYGIYWRRDKVTWKHGSSKLLGKQYEDSEPQDFSGQRGVYVLHDHLGPVYVGRALSDNLATRLKAHTKDRLSSRWSYFSWFGLNHTNETPGEIDSQSDSIDTKSVIAAIEAIMIEAMEPRLNRKQGDHINKTEFLQHFD